MAMKQAPAKMHRNTSRHIIKYIMLVNSACAIALTHELVLYALRKAIVRYVMEPIVRTHSKMVEDGVNIR